MEPRLVETRAPRDPDGIVLVLHGGASRAGHMAVSPTQLSVLRMIPIAKRLAHAGRGRLAVFRLLNSYRGWDTQHTPVHDVAWAMDGLRQRYGDRATALVGHSLGGRAALMAGREDGVRSIVALNPWVYPNETIDLTGRRVLFVHGTADRIATPDRSRAVAERLARSTDVGFISVPGAKHAMLRQGSVFEEAAVDFVTATLLGTTPSSGSAVARVLAGESWVSL